MLALLAELHDRGELAGVRRIHLPRVDKASLAAVLPVAEPDH